MKPNLIVGLVLVALGGAVFAYDHFSFTTTEQVLKVGPITATAQKQHDISLPPILGWLLVAGGIGVLAYGALGRKG